MAGSLKNFPIYKITQNMLLSATEPISLTVNKNSLPIVNFKEPRPLVVLLEYMNAKRKHVQKISDIYLNWKYDVLQISLKPLQLLYPVGGSQVVAKNLVEFLRLNEQFSPLIIHAFSVGGYVWGETLVQIKSNLKLYQPVVDRIKGQIFDSPADFEAIPTAFPSSIFPKNSLLRTLFRKYLSFHMKIHYESATKHYLMSRKAFTGGIIKAPSLMITSNADILSTPESALKARDEILKQNLVCEIKIFNGSEHVMHFVRHPTDYVSEVQTFLNNIGQATPVDFKSKL